MGSVHREWGCSFYGNQHFHIVQQKSQSNASFPLILFNLNLCQIWDITKIIMKDTHALDYLLINCELWKGYYPSEFFYSYTLVSIEHQVTRKPGYYYPQQADWEMEICEVLGALFCAYNFICLFIFSCAGSSLLCSLFSSCGEWGSFFVAVRGLLITVAS